MDTEEALLREYEKTVELFMSEGRIAWQLVSIWVVVQAGLGSALALFLAQKITLGSTEYSILFSVGIVSNVAWILIQYRAKMWRENWFMYGLRLERQLNHRGINLGIFEFERRVRDKKRALELLDNTIRERKQTFWERIGALRLAHWGMYFMTGAWSLLLLLHSVGVLAS